MYLRQLSTIFKSDTTLPLCMSAYLHVYLPSSCCLWMRESVKSPLPVRCVWRATLTCHLQQMCGKYKNFNSTKQNFMEAEVWTDTRTRDGEAVWHSLLHLSGVSWQANRWQAGGSKSLQLSVHKEQSCKKSMKCISSETML